MTLDLVILLGMISALLPNDGSLAPCRLKILLASNAVITAESVHTSYGWTFIHLGEDDVLGVPDSHVLSIEEDCAPLDEAAIEPPGASR
nr:hypothetical protein [Anaerolineae bacterium]